MTSDPVTPEDLDTLMGKLSWEALNGCIMRGEAPETHRTCARIAGLVDALSLARTDLGDAIVARLRELAAGLTRPQEGVLGRAADQGGRIYPYAAGLRVTTSLVKKRLMRWVDSMQRGADITPLGRAVAAVIGGPT